MEDNNYLPFPFEIGVIVIKMKIFFMLEIDNGMWLQLN